ncbi:hypothetical protein GF391_03545 [Candidatus Uhrbacteria bacterium]|nr:hypothetical protein [Candidatus Uhrbacteria bacterium]
MHQIPVPKGTRVVLLRHAISDWNEETIRALKAGSKKPTRLPGKRNAPLSPMGHLEAYCAAKYLAGIFSAEDFAQKGLMAYSQHMRAKETARVIMEHGPLKPRQKYQSEILAERLHARYAYIYEPEKELYTRASLDPKEGLNPFNGSKQIIDSDMADMRELLRHQPKLAPMLMSNNDMHLAAVYILTSFRDSLEFFYREELERSGKVTPGKLIELRRTAASKALVDYGSRIAPDFADWFFKQVELEPNERRKTPTGESFPDMRERAIEFSRDLNMELDEVGSGAIAIVVTHSFFMLSLRQLWEGFSNDALNEMITAEGPPFPPHVGMVFYKESDGKLVPDGDPYVLPPELEVSGRRLRFRADVPQSKIDEICRLLGVEQFRKKRNRGRRGNRSHSDHRFRFCVPSERAEPRPGLFKTRASSEDDSEKKAS